MLQLKYPILQSGFVGLSEVGLTKQIPQTPTFSDVILFQQMNHEYDNLFYSHDVSDLFNDWQANFQVMKKFEFKEKILKQALINFGPNVGEWLMFQAHKPCFSHTHKQFLLRMCEWMTESHKSPYISSEGIKWIGLLGPSQGNNVGFDLSPVIPRAMSMTSVNVISNWVAKDAGYESLLVHLYVIFGRRVGHTQKTTM